MYIVLILQVLDVENSRDVTDNGVQYICMFKVLLPNGIDLVIIAIATGFLFESILCILKHNGRTDRVIHHFS